MSSSGYGRLPSGRAAPLLTTIESGAAWLLAIECYWSGAAGPERQEPRAATVAILGIEVGHLDAWRPKGIEPGCETATAFEDFKALRGQPERRLGAQVQQAHRKQSDAQVRHIISSYVPNERGRFR